MSQGRHNKNPSLPEMMKDWQQESVRILTEKLLKGTIDPLDLIQAYESNQDFRRIMFKTNKEVVVRDDSILFQFHNALAQYKQDLKTGVEEPVIELSPEAFYFGKHALMEVLGVKPVSDSQCVDFERNAPVADDKASPHTAMRSVADPAEQKRQNQITALKHLRNVERSREDRDVPKVDWRAMIGFNK